MAARPAAPASYDGSFTGLRLPGEGVTAALLRTNGIRVFSDKEIDALVALIDAH